MEKRKKIMAGVLSVMVIGLGYFLYEGLVWISTDDAQVQAHTLMLSSKVGGVVIEVMAEENQKVKAGQALARLDPREYANEVKQAESQVGSQAAKLKDAETGFKRMADLYSKSAVSKQQYDNAEANFQDLSKRYLAAQAGLDTANLNLSYTEIKAPADGIVGRKSIEPGMVIPPGQAMFGFVDASSRWVVANFKETELKYIEPGKPAEVTVDAISHRSFEGVVESVSPSTGATFSLLPPDNATGNFTKVVQRVPIRVKLTNLSESDIDHLRAGLSADVSIRRH